MLQSLALIGLSTIGYKITRAVIPYIRQAYKLPTNKYIIINGCTDGIGKQYAKYMYNNNIPLILIGRNSTKLQSLNQQLSQMQKQKINNTNTTDSIQNKLIQIDYSDHNLTYQSYKQILQNLSLSSKSVAGIINCCGIAYLQPYNLLSMQQVNNIKNVNTYPLQLCLKMLTYQFMDVNPFIINISSYTSHYPLKYSAVYSATKAYVSNLLQAYHKQNSNIKVLTVQPWYVSTKMTGFRKGWDCVTPQQVVIGSMSVLGHRSICTGTIKHQLIYQFGYWLQKYYFPLIIQKNYQRVKKLIQLKTKRLNRKNKNIQDKNQ